MPERIEPRHETVMDVTQEQIARVYAQAFMGVANKSPNVDELIGELDGIVNDVLTPFPRFEEVLSSALVSHEKTVALIDRVLAGRASAPVLNFLKVLSIHRRLGLLRLVLKFVKKIHAEQRGLTDVQVRVAKELDPALRSELQERLRATLGREPVLHITVDEALIGGIILQVGDRVFDASIHTRLEYARRNIISRATEVIETKPERFMISRT
jgi:F-type H+-transporting ATPase subunit delta